MKNTIMILGACSLATTGCAVTKLDPAAANVTTISAAAAAQCTYIDTISANNMNTLSKDPQADARARAYNQVAKLGGNSLQITDTDTQVSSSGIGSIFTITGSVYRCP